MRLTLDAASRTRIIIDEVADHDLTDATIEVSIGGTWYPATWDDAGTSGNEWDPATGRSLTRWRRTARTTDYFAGPDAPAGSAVTLPLGRYPTETRLTAGNEILVADSGTLEVRA